LDSKQIVENKYGGHIRVRVCGVLFENSKYLMANHQGINYLGDFWCGPGGGLEFGESIETALKREFLEEAGLKIEVGKFIEFIEFVKPPLHAIELFFEVKKIGGNFQLGHDPETGNSILKEVKWMELAEIEAINPSEIHKFYHKFLI
jgi:8-oxo-dGTP diphosphatase